MLFVGASFRAAAAASGCRDGGGSCKVCLNLVDGDSEGGCGWGGARHCWCSNWKVLRAEGDDGDGEGVTAAAEAEAAEATVDAAASAATGPISSAAPGPTGEAGRTSGGEDGGLSSSADDDAGDPGGVVAFCRWSPSA